MNFARTRMHAPLTATTHTYTYTHKRARTHARTREHTPLAAATALFHILDADGNGSLSKEVCVCARVYVPWQPEQKCVCASACICTLSYPDADGNGSLKKVCVRACVCARARVRACVRGQEFRSTLFFSSVLIFSFFFPLVSLLCRNSGASLSRFQMQRSTSFFLK